MVSASLRLRATHPGGRSWKGVGGEGVGGVGGGGTGKGGRRLTCCWAVLDRVLEGRDTRFWLTEKSSTLAGKGYRGLGNWHTWILARVSGCSTGFTAATTHFRTTGRSTRYSWCSRAG